MKFIGTEFGQVAWLIPPEEIRPIGGIDMFDAIAKITQEFNFRFPPDLPEKWEDAKKATIHFGSGSIQLEDRAIIIRDFISYNDGFVVNSLTTEDAELALSLITAWAKDTIGLRTPSSSPRKYYKSQIIVEFESDMNRLISGFNQISKHYYSRIRDLYNVEQEPELFRITMNCDRFKIPGTALSTDFNFERRLNIPYSDNRFFSDAPLPTEEHVTFLELLERVVD